MRPIHEIRAHLEYQLAEKTKIMEEGGDPAHTWGDVYYVREALKRLDDGTYGICTECGKEIAEKRLEAIPYTPVCILCAMASEA